MKNLKTFKEYFEEGYARLPEIDRERYQEKSGLEGPFMTATGKVVYYDPKEGKYYDSDSDMYISDEDMAEIDDKSKIDYHQSPLTDPQSKEYQHMQRKGI